MVLEPGVAEDHALLPEVGDSEGVGRESFGESFLPFGSLRQDCPDRGRGGERGCVYRFTNFCIDFFYI